MTINNHTLFEDPQVKYPPDSVDMDFSAYISQCQALIKNTRVDLVNNPQAVSIIAANTPFELQPETPCRAGALLVHGLYDCPFVMQDIGKILQTQGLLIRSVLLPGHGTVPGALLNVTYQDWLDSMAYGLKQLARSVDKIFLVGFSTGATLALHQVLKNSDPQIAGLILLAPAIQISALAGFMNFPPKLTIKWFGKNTENDYAKYNSFTCNSAYQLHLLIEKNNQLSLAAKNIDCPSLVVISQDDQTVKSRATIQYFQRHLAQRGKLLLYTNQPNNSDPRFICRPACYPKWNIRNISHIALPIAPDNPHYGMQGDYAHASRVEENNRHGKKMIYGTLNNYTHAWLNLMNHFHLYPHQYSRLTFNPDFEFLKSTIVEFISSH
jgi:esterase/lipase